MSRLSVHPDSLLLVIGQWDEWVLAGLQAGYVSSNNQEEGWVVIETDFRKSQPLTTTTESFFRSHIDLRDR